MPIKALELLGKYWKAFAIIALCAASYLWGRSSASVEKLVTRDVVVERIVEVEKKTKKNDKVTTTVQAPDGTVTTTIVDHTITTESSTTNTNSVGTSTVKETKPAPSTQVKDYGLGLKVEVPATLRLDDKTPSYTVELGRRLVFDLWLEASYNYSDRQIGLGFRYEF